MTKKEYEEAHYFFLKLWTDNVGKPDYIKRIWRNIDNLMRIGWKYLEKEE